MIFVNTAHMVLSSTRLCYILTPCGVMHPLDGALLGLNVVCALDIAVRLNVGYFEREGRQAVMDRRRILW